MSVNQNPDEATRRELLLKAAQCYIKAGWLADACRVWEQIGEYQQAAQTYEEQSLWEQAAQCYTKAKNWSNAARCYLMCEQPQAAASSWLEAGDTLQATWILADSLLQIYQVQAQLTNFSPQNPTQAIEIELITARCEASSRKKSQSATRLRQQLDSLLTQSQQHLYTWALRIAQVLNRPDLTALIYATAYRAKIPDACQQWEKWAIATLGDATGVPKPEESDSLKTYKFEVVTVNRRGEIITKAWRQARYFTEYLLNGVELEMVYIPGGTFMMGSPDDEKPRPHRQTPQHTVTIKPFYMGKYQITQAQWRAVANMPKIQRDLNPNPSYFEGENRPVECVSWENAVEFCQRLSAFTKREYTLPSEAQWEYAARAGTTTPFHYGETITGQLANYYANETYAEEPPGEYREQTTPVGSFPPNSFGLYDIHGNVDEWCADPWHDSYEGAPTDGRVWVYNSTGDKYYTLRGGAWSIVPRDCRSASRDDYSRRGVISSHVGFRVSCGVERT
ncbi:SUMF1/EgtB/PvdO family nonheme iron enzyme [Aetokthonos hydrillicola Thurmond2011]|jgi:formylglycine-generating enzyme required for sulfatase activity|uniref:SUMF1/EgtB/PvdO family nonheme iron enzyme n=1 Tax=Aetokthonos hydrillicola Thurmond2011 TaxID=2712845 RepID=A0AAP5ID60_9CYAN|nr:formylglycine-generating enzyme family protein [Aetokthonos hydrillicola]MBO3459567.1 SUMF1/EgtB/PvdO family nonheme iron enzyme [Aetokthonos hydrillicola CCALA 1050]MBW4590317.1 SUMF1/EgtB/PvdO family nonheme iron enzyme [Aetokthonos hydrillicola CCALA 1050]MDR9899396.1 SUMF1/EgtB/PvdO family nonheme iron enzyme [Aetokthonos hydrillicola Thurmond2011]